MKKTQFEKNGGYFINGVAYMDCKVTGEPVANVSTDIKSVIGSKAVMGMVGLPKDKPKRVSTGRPAGWHWMNEFVDKDGTVYHKGVEQPDLKMTRPVTLSKEKKKILRRTQEEILLAREAEKKAVLKKEFQKQKDLLNHKLWEK